MLRISTLGPKLLRTTDRFLAKKVRYLAAKASYLNCPGTEPLLYKTVADLVDEAAEKYGDRPAIIANYQKQRTSFGEAKEKAETLARALLKLGAKKGDRIGIWAPNSTEWYISNLAIAKCGAISVYMNPAYQGPEVLHCLNKAGVKMLITADTFKTQDYYKILEGISPEIQNCQPGKLKSESVPSLETVIFITDKDLPGSYKYKDIYEEGKGQSRAELDEVVKTVEPENICNIQFTSGTTGKPKGASLSHFAIVNNSYLISQGLELQLKHHKVCFMGPFFHAMGSVIGILSCFHYGSTMVIPDYSFNPESAVNDINNEKCTILLGTPTMYIDIFRKMSEKNITLNTVEMSIAGGALCSPELYKDMTGKLGVKRAVWLYGLTESGPVAFMTRSDDGPEKVIKTVGRLMPHTEAKVVDANGNILPQNVPGELLLRGFLIMDGYWGDEERTKETITPTGWLRTGDQFIIDEYGYGKIVGRIKDLIIRGGENISPLEIEEFLITHPDAVDVQVFGVPDERLGEQVCACLKLKPGSNLTKAELQQYCKGNIAHFKIPHYIFFVDEFPKTDTGKIQRYKMRETVLKMLEKAG
ncbi:UNVERIFIED_CONTAM: hypothetical protein PYX00_009900 [Menopon gallinae]|uniref:Medium-chain acyl-CoA ligase ACSF2, mitochondrial n=1 Tax=Menopon gallinae TaxID=328185 RepID=A0AAW2HDW9_9NEOP